jgi:hypothetical protein
MSPIARTNGRRGWPVACESGTAGASDPSPDMDGGAGCSALLRPE